MRQVDEATDLNLLPILHALLETRSVTRAAERLRMSQPAVSRALARLRNRFGDPLLARGARGLVPTARAEALAGPLSEALLATAALFASPPGFDPAQQVRAVRLCTTDYGAIAVLPRLLPLLMAEAPNLSIEVVPLSRDAMRALASGELDLLLYGDDDLPSACRARVLFKDDYACLARPGHPAVRDGVLDLDAYCDAPHLLVSLFGGGRGVVDHAIAARGRTRRVILALPYFALAPMLLAGDMLLTLPRRAAMHHAGMTRLNVLDPPIALPSFPYRLVWHERTHHDPAAAWLRGRVMAACRT